ncbi:hypothetical protein BH10ACT8_BH10ACT8_26250 [soil metagenome]|jgi:hypothetical protein
MSESTDSIMSEPELFVLADRTLNNIVGQIAPDQWTLAIPDWIPLGSHVNRADLNLRTLINYHAYDDIWVPDMLAGRTMAEVGSDKWRDEDLLGDAPAANFAAIVEKAVQAATAVTEQQLSATAHLSFGDYTVAEYFWQITQFRTFRAYEFASLIGVDATLPADLVAGVWKQLEPNVEEWRAIGVFGPAKTVADDASQQDRLLALTGRTPRRAG